MNGLEYLDFDLLFEKSGEEYVARVVNSPAGQAVSRFSLPFSALEAENILLRIGRTRRGVRRLESPEMELTRIFGAKLFAAIFRDEMLGCLRSSLNESYNQGLGLRLRLRLSATPELSDLPWEFLYDSTRNQFMVLSTKTPLVRYLDLPDDIQPLPVTLPLKVLVMIASPHDFPSLDVEAEWARLNEALADLQALGLVALTRLEKPTLAHLQRQLRRDRYHIFHFIGHGAFDSQAQDGVLLTEDESGRGRMVSGRDLGTLLHDHRSLRLAVLNACEGARSSLSDPFAGAAQSLVQQGLPAVIAMQFEITDPAAIALAHEFYNALADGLAVDAALTEARKAIFAQGNDVEWATPVLYLRVAEAAIFRISPAERPQVEPPAVQVAAAPVTQTFPELNPDPEPEAAASLEATPTGAPAVRWLAPEKPKQRSRAVFYAAGVVLFLILSLFTYQAMNQAPEPLLPDTASSKIPLEELTTLEELEPLLARANIRLSDPEDEERTRSYFYGPDSAYHQLAVAVLLVIDGRFEQPIHLDIVDKWYTEWVGSGYADDGPLDLDLVEEAIIAAHNDYYGDDAVSLDDLLEP